MDAETRGSVAKGGRRRRLATSVGLDLPHLPPTRTPRKLPRGLVRYGPAAYLRSRFDDVLELAISNTATTPTLLNQLTTTFRHLTRPRTPPTPRALHARHGRPRIMDLTASNSIDTPWMFSATPAKPTPALALARAGGPAGTTYLYTLDDDALGTSQGSYSASATGPKRWV